MKTFVVNCGSSSVKYKLYSMTHETVMASGLLERVGSQGSLLHHSAGGETSHLEVDAPNHTAGMEHILRILTDRKIGVLKSIGEIAGVGHRVVHGGEKYNDSVLIEDEVLRTIEDHFVLSPLHNPPNLAGIRASMEAMPDTPQVAVFDTAFFASMPRKAWMYAVPWEWYETHRVRKYGFHGTSHRYVTYQVSRLLKKPEDQLNLITCHLGNGCSMTAVANGKAVDHSMGMTPLPGLVMGTRSGDIDPAIVFYMIQNLGLSPTEVDRQLNKHGGLLGVSGVSNDMRDCLNAARQGNDRAALAVDLFVYRVIHYVGAYYALLPKLDAIVLTGGIGENSVEVRRAVCEGLARLGVTFDAALNQITVGGKTGPITSPEAATPVWIVPTNEELMIARDTKALVAGAMAAG